MKKGKHRRQKIRILDRYLVLLIIAILSMLIAYAQTQESELTVAGNAESKVQEGVFIKQINYKSNLGADTQNSVVNYFLGTMMDSKIVLGNGQNSTITYEVTVYNNTDKEQVYIKTLTDDTDEILYSNTNIGYSVSLEEYVTTIAPRQSLTFTITFAYNGTNTSNPVLESKLNFRFREKPVIELSNENATYTLEEIYAGYTPAEYTFTVKNYNTTYTNSVPMTYKFVTTLTNGSPLYAKIYDNKTGAEVTGNIEIGGTAQETHSYTLKIIWDSIQDGEEYKGQNYTCNVKLIATPDDKNKYIDYSIEKQFNVEITTAETEKIIIPISTVEDLFKIGSNEQVTIGGETYTFSADANYGLQNDITFTVSDYLDYVEQYPNSFDVITTTMENEATDYGTANSTQSPYYTYIAPATGTYRLQVWGAQGGYRSSSSYGGLGGYSVGTITLNEGEELYVYVGGAGGSGSSSTSGVVAGGYNGGGYRYGYKGGGGASDIRLTAGAWNDSSSLLSRVIVAGGGGSDGATNRAGGYGGGTSGGDSTSGNANSSYNALGGEQTYSGYSSSYTIATQTTSGLTSDTLANYAGGFGFGGGGVYMKSGYGGAGGGGWYGGAGTVPNKNKDDEKGGGGGSGFVWTSATSSNVPSGYSVAERYYLADAATYGGNTSFESTSGGSETGHSGNGYAKITLLSGTTQTVDWKNIDTRLDEGTLTGEFLFNGYTITVNEEVYPKLPTVTAEVSNITTSSATISAEGVDPLGKDLQYTLLINGTVVAGLSDTKEWTIGDLTHNTTYSYTVRATNGRYIGEVTGEFTTETLTVTADVSNITTSGATITAACSDEAGETVQYTLYINGTVFAGPSESNEWTIGDLTHNTTYSYKVEATKGINTCEVTGEFTTETLTVTADVSNITTSGATITASCSDEAGETVQYTLYVNGTLVAGPSETKEWTIGDLTHNTTYSYKVEATKGTSTCEVTGEFTTETLTVTADVSNITTSGVTITAACSDEAGETVQYTLYINGTVVAGPSETNEWIIGDLNDNTTYSYVVEVTDGKNTATFTGELKIECLHDWDSAPIPTGAGIKYTETGEYTDPNGDTAMIPAGFTVSGAAGSVCTKCGLTITGETTIEDGLVIYLIDDKTPAEIEAMSWEEPTNLRKTYDQFVWIPMPRENINDMYMCQSEDGTKGCRITVQDGEAYCTTHSSTAMAGRLYSRDSLGDVYDPSWTGQKYSVGFYEPGVSSNTQYTSLNNILSTSFSESVDFRSYLQAEYKEIVKSVYQNEGFYIGRYETSNFTTTTGMAVKVVAGSSVDLTSEWEILYSQQKMYAENKELSSVGSAMIQDAAYDQVMNFVNTDSYDVTVEGNVSHDLDEPYQTGGLNYTGTIKYNDVSKNIYDLEGNVEIYTTSCTSGASGHNKRGGSYWRAIGASYGGYALDDRWFNHPTLHRV